MSTDSDEIIKRIDEKIDIYHGHVRELLEGQQEQLTLIKNDYYGRNGNPGTKQVVAVLKDDNKRRTVRERLMFGGLITLVIGWLSNIRDVIHGLIK